MSRLLMIVTGYGPPRVAEKHAWLKNNIDQVKRTFTGNVFVRLFNYGTEPCGCDDVDEETMTPGYVGQFLYRYMPPETVQQYDYVMCILDDIELSASFNVDRALHNLHSYGLDIIQPALTQTSPHSHAFMLQDATAGVRITNYLEYFCYLMTPIGYAKWYNLFDDKTAWMWGLDWCLAMHNIATGILDATPAHHHIKGASYSSNNSPSAFLECFKTRERLKCDGNLKQSAIYAPYK